MSKKEGFSITIPRQTVLDLISPVETPVGTFPVDHPTSTLAIQLDKRGTLAHTRMTKRYVIPVHDGQYVVVEQISHPEVAVAKKKSSAKKRRVAEVAMPERTASPFSALAGTVIQESTYLQNLHPRLQDHIHNALVDFAGVGVEAVGQRWNSLSTDEQLRLTSRVVRDNIDTAMDQMDAVAMLLMTSGMTEGRAMQQSATAFRQLFQLIQTNTESVQEYRQMVARNKGKHLNPAEVGRKFHSNKIGPPNTRRTGLPRGSQKKDDK